MSPLQWAVVAICSLIAGLAKVAFGVGSGVFLTPVLALVIDPKIVVGLMLPMMMVTDVTALRLHWRKWHGGHLKVLLPTVFVGIVLGTLFLTWAPSALVRKALGVIAVAYVAIQLVRLRGSNGKAQTNMSPRVGSAIGLVSGVVTGIAHSGGVILSIYLLSVGLAKNTFISTLVVIFLAGDLLKTPLYWQTGILTTPMVVTGLALAPILLLGGQLGISLNRRISTEQFTAVVIAIVGLSGAILLIR